MASLRPRVTEVKINPCRTMRGKQLRQIFRVTAEKFYVVKLYVLGFFCSEEDNIIYPLHGEKPYFRMLLSEFRDKRAFPTANF